MRRLPGSLPLALVACLATAGIAGAASVSIVPFAGPKANVPRDQLVKALCAAQTCIPQANVTNKKGKPDFAKAKKEKVDVVLVGTIAGPASKRVLQLEAFDRKGKRVWREKLELARNGKLPRSAVDQVTGHFESAAETTPPPVETKKPPPEEERKPAEEETPKKHGHEDEETSKPMTFNTPPPGGDHEEKSGGSSDESEVTAKPEHPTRHEKQPLLVAGAGIDFVHRSFEYTDLGAPNLRSYETRPMLFAPRLHAEVYPLTKILTGIPTGLGVEADYTFALFLRSIDENDVPHSTSVTKFDLAARCNFTPLDDKPLMVAPILGYRSATFEVGPGPDGSKLAGLPGISYSALTLGAEGEYGLGLISLTARLSYVQLLGLGEIGGNDFFPSHGGNAIEAQVGGGYEVMKNLQIRLLLHYTRYGLSFKPAEGATYNASGAVDQYAGGSVMARYTY